MSERRSVREELERKRVQLAQMRQERERRSRMLQDENAMPTNLDGQGRLDDADAVLKALGLSTSLSRASTAPSNVSSLDQSASRLLTQSPDISNASILSPQLSTTTAAHSTSSTTQQHVQSTPKSDIPLQVVHVNQINIAPKERVFYTKSTQTPVPITNQSVDQSTANADTLQQKSYYGKQPPCVTSTTQLATGETQNISANQPQSPPASLSSGNAQVAGTNNLTLEWDDEFPVLTYQDDEDEASSDFNNMPSDRQSKSTSTAQGLPNVEMVKPATNGHPANHTERAPVKEIREISEEERKQIELREDYQLFVDKATKILERALHQNEKSEIFVQYFPDGGEDAIDSDRKRGNKLSLSTIFMDDKWSKNRCVTGLDWSAQHQELLLASYHTNEEAPSDPDGTLLVWNMKFNTSPEYVFHCQSPVMSCCFAKFHPSLIVGGTYSGQIVLWDMRANKKTPVQRSSLTATAHTHPVYCCKMVGTQNAHNLISVSTDGKLCSWSLDMLSSPQETMELNQQKQTRSVAVTCMSFHPSDYNNFLIGSEEGSVHAACRHGSKTGILSSFESHQGLVTNVDYRPTESGQAGYSHLFLTSSIDWTVKLWDTKEPEPIHTFESNGDYIYDVKWSPNNPALFATADGDGRIDVWNLANDSELPTASTHIEPVAMSESAKAAQPSLNKLVWTPEGHKVVVGDNVGRIHLYDIGGVGDMNSPLTQQEDKWKLGGHIA